MLSVGLTGNIASGKSTVAELFQRWGATIIDADRLVREAQAPGSSCCGPSWSDSGAQCCGGMEASTARVAPRGDGGRGGARGPQPYRAPRGEPTARGAARRGSGARRSDRGQRHPPALRGDDPRSSTRGAGGRAGADAAGPAGGERGALARRGRAHDRGPSMPPSGNATQSDFVIDNDGRSCQRWSALPDRCGSRCSRALDLSLRSPILPPATTILGDRAVSNVPDDLRLHRGARVRRARRAMPRCRPHRNHRLRAGRAGRRGVREPSQSRRQARPPTRRSAPSRRSRPSPSCTARWPARWWRSTRRSRAIPPSSTAIPTAMAGWSSSSVANPNDLDGSARRGQPTGRTSGSDRWTRMRTPAVNWNARV